MLLGLSISPDMLREFCRRHHISSLSVFGSALRNELRPDSDIDVLVSFSAGRTPSLLRFVAAERELGALLGRRVDLVMREALLQHPNDPRTREIMATSRVLYAA